MRQHCISMGIFLAVLAGAAPAQSTVGDALKNKPGSVGLQDTAANSSSTDNKDGEQVARSAPKTAGKARPVPGKDAAPLGGMVNRAGRDKAAPDDSSGHGTKRTDSRKSTNGTDTSGRSNMVH